MLIRLVEIVLCKRINVLIELYCILESLWRLWLRFSFGDQIREPQNLFQSYLLIKIA